jgi:battenin
LINNVLYVIILSAALDLVGPNVPKGVALLADVVPSFLVKLCAPYFISLIPYSWRIILFSTLSALGMLLVATTPSYTDGGTIGTKMAGVVLASLSSGGGELSFLGLTHFYGPFSLAAWGSGTGGAGLVGAGAYSLATTTLGLSVRKSLFASSFLPVIMLVSFFAVLPRDPLSRSQETLASSKCNTALDDDSSSEDPLLAHDAAANTTNTPSPTRNWRTDFIRNLHRARGLVIP